MSLKIFNSKEAVNPEREALKAGRLHQLMRAFDNVEHSLPLEAKTPTPVAEQRPVVQEASPQSHADYISAITAQTPVEASVGAMSATEFADTVAYMQAHAEHNAAQPEMTTASEDPIDITTMTQEQRLEHARRMLDRATQEDFGLAA